MGLTPDERHAGSAGGRHLESGRLEAGLTHGELWLRYFELGGMSSALDVEAFLYGALVPSNHDHDVVAHALNERFSELGRDYPVAYSDDKAEGLVEDEEP